MQVASIPAERMEVEYMKNHTLVRLLRKFYNSVIEAEEVFNFVEELPKILYTKQENWMTKKLLEPDLIRLKKVQN